MKSIRNLFAAVFHYVYKGNEKGRKSGNAFYILHEND